MGVRSLPLGVDIGSTRIRVASSVWSTGSVALRAVATRDIATGVATSGMIADPEYVGAILEQLRDELQVKERRCVCSVGVPDAALKTLQLPSMTWMERRRAATFEALSSENWRRQDALVRVHPVDERKNLHAVGVAAKAVVASRLQALRSGGLVPVAIDYDTFAYARILGRYDAIVDVGLERTAAHLLRREKPLSICRARGGADITRAIEQELSVDSQTAEKRKRIVGTAGAGEGGRAVFLADITRLLESVFSADATVKRVAVCGNGARLARFTTDLANASGLEVGLALPPAPLAGTYPPDVFESAAPDWALAIGLSLWGSRDPF